LWSYRNELFLKKWQSFSFFVANYLLSYIWFRTWTVFRTPVVPYRIWLWWYLDAWRWWPKTFTLADAWWPKTFLYEQMGGCLVYILWVISVHPDYVEVERVSRFLYHICTMKKLKIFLTKIKPTSLLIEDPLVRAKVSKHTLENEFARKAQLFSPINSPHRSHHKPSTCPKPLPP